MFEIRKRDSFGRIGILKIGKKKVETPNIAVVVNPNKMTVDMSFLKDLGVEIIITNSYILKKSKYKNEIVEKGIHNFLGFDGVIYTDSGTFQMYSQGNVEITNEETIDFQKEIGSDIITPLDVFTLPQDNYDISKTKMEETLRRIKYLNERAKGGNFYYSFPIQGGMHLSLRERMSKIANTYDPIIYAIGGIVPLMESYNYVDLMKIILEIKRSLKSNGVVHAFGVGHPMIFGLLILAGVDLFDSASYSLYAENGRYIMEDRTYYIKDMEYLPCTCPICVNKTPHEMTKEDIAKHNLYVIFKEIRKIKESIRRGNLWEYVEQRISSHPELIKAYNLLRDQRYRNMFVSVESSTKQTSLFWIREETSLRVLFDRVNEKLSYVNSTMEHFEWIKGIKVPISLSLTYPFGQFQYLKSYEKYKEKLKKIILKKGSELDVIKDILAWELESSKIYSFEGLKEYTYKISHTGRIKYIEKEGEVVATLRPKDNIFIIKKRLARVLFSKGILHKWVMVSDEAKGFVERGKDVFSKFIVHTSENIYPEDIVAIVDEDNNFLNVGFSLLSSKEMLEFKKGIAVTVKG